MRYERLKDIVHLAIHMQGSRTGMTLGDIEAEFKVSRRTAERLRDTVEWAFGPLETVPQDDSMRHWRLRSDALRRLVTISAEEMAELSGAADALERAGLGARAQMMREIACKLRAAMQQHTLDRIEADVEALVLAEGLAMRPGPRPRLDADLLSLLREAVVTGRVVEFHYIAQSTGRRSRQSVQPYGLLHGNRAFLVGRTDWAGELRLWRLANVSDARLTDERFERDPAFNLRAYARRSFGTFQEKPAKVVLRFLPRAARDATAFLFHPSQAVETNGDGSVTVKFTAGGIDEMCWHLVTWGDSVIVEKPARLRKRLATMCQTLALHHGAANPVERESQDSQRP
ncbi:MAG: WYL domain-containing protein [bacterium]|nr:WYL domain-containing protein [bacterium]